MKYCLLISVLIFFSCEKRPELIRSNSIKNLILFKNAPKNVTESKLMIKQYLIKEFSKKSDFPIYIYNYSSNTEFFLDHNEDPGGFSSEEFIRYEEADGIAVYGFVQCEKDSTKYIAIIRYYKDDYGDFYKPDTIFENCE